MKIDCCYDELVDLSKLVKNPKNPNTHSKEQIERLAKIIEYQGMRRPIIVSKRSGFMTAGHGRLMALELLKWEKAPVDFQDYENEAQEYADMVADNAIAEWSEQELDKISSDFTKLDTDIDVDLLGLKEFELLDAEVLEPQCGEDEVPEIKEEPITKRGDVWLLGEHRVMCGDSTMIDDVEKLMNGEKADMVYTDPPYGMNLDVDYDKMFKDKNHKAKGDRFTKVIADDSYFDPRDILAMVSDVKEVWLWGADYFYDSLPRGGSMCSWDKRTENLDKVVGNTTEFLWSKQPHRRMTARVLWSGHHGMGKDDDKKRIHPTQKPITLHDWFFENFGGKHKKILDLFLGSGSTLIACEKTNRKCYGMELDPFYVDVIVQRYVNYTGNKNITLNGEPYVWETR